MVQKIYSRLPFLSLVLADPAADVEPELVAQISCTLGALPVADFAAASSTCPELTSLREQIHHGWPPSIRAVDQDLTPYDKVRDELSVKDFTFRGSKFLPSSVWQMLIV